MLVEIFGAIGCVRPELPIAEVVALELSVQQGYKNAEIVLKRASKTATSKKQVTLATVAVIAVCFVATASYS